MKYPHMSGSSDFPAVGGSANVAGVDVFKYDNAFDYSRYDFKQMELCICQVPWDMGEAHIGNRTISGVGNVVFFGDETTRDAWFDGLDDSECVRFSTKYKELHYKNEIIVELPFDVACKYNYVEVKYHLFANDGSPVKFESQSGINHWFWFIREVQFVAPNTTRLILLPDAWQTFIYGFDITEIMLERGHAAMALGASVADYLASPRTHTDYLLAEDVTFEDEGRIVKASRSKVFNGADSVCVIVTSGDVFKDWGSKGNGWWTPGYEYYNIQGLPTYYAFAISPADLATLCANASRDMPQFFQTVKGIFFISESLLNLGDLDPFTFLGVSCRKAAGGYTESALHTIAQSDFAYPSQYAGITKLYTYPYAHIEIADENGDVTQVRIEDTDGTISVNTCVSLAFPWINVAAHLGGIGGGNRSALTFKALESRDFSAGGRWYTHLREWKIPIVGIMQDAYAFTDPATYYDRQQRALEATTAKDNVTDSTDGSAITSYDNAVASASAAKSDAYGNADTIVNNAALQAAANTANATTMNTKMNGETNINTLVNQNKNSAAHALTNATTNAQIDATRAAASIAADAGAISSAASAVGSALSGNFTGAISGAISGVASYQATLATAQVGVNQTSTQANATLKFNDATRGTSNSALSAMQTVSETYNNDSATNANAMVTGAAANSAATMKGNADRDYTANEANAQRTYDSETANAQRTYDTSIAGIQATWNNAGMGAPKEFGAWADGDTATTRPLMISSNVVTQSADAIAHAGDEFLRYGYMLNRRIHFDGDWCKMRNFTYWKLRDFWVRNLNVPDMYADRLRFFLFGGVTVWSDPAKIGNVTIYDNI